MNKLGIALSVLFSASVMVTVGFGAYYTTLYFNRAKNKRFEAAYIYDTTFSNSVDVNLGLITPDSPVTQTIPVVSMLNKDIQVVLSFGSNSDETFDYISVSFNGEQEKTLLDDYIRFGKKFSTQFKSKEARSIDITYTLSKEKLIPANHEIDFSIFIKAYDTNYEW